MIKSHALKKMAELFRRWKNELKTEFVDEKKIPEFIGKYEKIRDQWPAFVAHKTSEKSKKMSTTNKKNAAKKKHHHRTGSGGYLVARPKWANIENDLVDKGIEPETINWPDRCRTWFFGAGGTLDPVTGKCIWTNDQMDIPVRKLQHYIEAAQQGTFFSDRENDELTMALGILSTLDGHEARQAPFRGRLGFRTQAVTNPRRGGKNCSRPKCRRCKQG